MKDALRAASALFQQVAGVPPQVLAVARNTSALAASARLNWMNFAGVLKSSALGASPLRPGGIGNGNAVLPARTRSACAESSKATMYPYTESLGTNGAGGAVIGMSTSTGAPKLSRVTMRYVKASAFMVFAMPRDAAFSESETSPVPM